MISSLILAVAVTGGICHGGQCTVARPVQAVVRVASLPARVVGRVAHRRHAVIACRSRLCARGLLVRRRDR